MILLFSGCAVPQYIWPQKDIGFHEINQPTLEKRILIASRKSEFKNAVVQKIEDAFRNQAVYIKIIGIEDLKYKDADHYSTVVLINTAMGWKIDRKVERFLDGHKNLNSIIVLTTSGGGDIIPDSEKYHIDAVSSASTKDETASVTNKIIDKIKKVWRLQRAQAVPVH